MDALTLAVAAVQQHEFTLRQFGGGMVGRQQMVVSWSTIGRLVFSHVELPYAVMVWDVPEPDPDRCRYAVNPGHECVDAFGEPVRKSGRRCTYETRTQLLEQADRLRKIAARRMGKLHMMSDAESDARDALYEAQSSGGSLL